MKHKLYNLSALLVGALLYSSAQAHLMVAQHGTLNFLDDSVYVVLSLPASAFPEADEDGDNLLSLSEFSEHRLALSATVSKTVTLSDKKGEMTLEGIMVSPVTPHDAPKEPAAQIIVMGRFILNDPMNDLNFQIGIFGKQPENNSLNVKVTRKEADYKQEFILSSSSSIAKIEFKKNK